LSLEISEPSGNRPTGTSNPCERDI